MRRTGERQPAVDAAVDFEPESDEPVTGVAALEPLDPASPDEPVEPAFVAEPELSERDASFEDDLAPPPLEERLSFT